MSHSTTRIQPRTNFRSTRLAQLLSDWSVLEAPQAGNDFAERLSRWVNFTDAIALHGLHGSATPTAPSWPTRKQMLTPPVGDLGPNDEFTRSRLNMGNEISDSVRLLHASHLNQYRLAPQRSTPNATAPNLDESTYAPFAPYHQFYLARQRDMEVSVRKLRLRVRQQLAVASTALKQLSTLDAAFDGILVEREKKLLAPMSQHLQQRFHHLRAQHLGAPHSQARLDGGASHGNAAPGFEPAWLPYFFRELETALLAELDLRLQPTLGLIEALNHHTTPDE